MAKQYWACTHGDDMKMSPKLEFSGDALIAVFGEGAYTEPGATKAEPLGKNKKDAILLFDTLHEKHRRKVYKRRIATMDIERDLILDMLRVIEEAHETKQALIDDIKKSGPGHGVRWSASRAAGAEYKHRKAITIVRGALNGHNPIRVATSIKKEIKQELLRNDFNHNSTSYFHNAVRDAEGSGAASMYEYGFSAIKLADRREDARLDLKMEGTDYGAKYVLDGPLRERALKLTCWAKRDTAKCEHDHCWKCGVCTPKPTKKDDDDHTLCEVCADEAEKEND